MKKLVEQYDRFEAWFNLNFGWFFTNGNKVNRFEEVNYND